MACRGERRSPGVGAIETRRTVGGARASAARPYAIEIERWTPCPAERVDGTNPVGPAGGVRARAMLGVYTMSNIDAAGRGEVRMPRRRQSEMIRTKRELVNRP